MIEAVRNKLAALALVFACVATLAASTVDDATPDFAVVTNPANEVRFDSRAEALSEVRGLFLKNYREWSTRDEARPYGRSTDSQESIAFGEVVLRMSKPELARHWISIKNEKGLTPPKVVRSDKLLVSFVKKYEGAFGVMDFDAARNSGLRILLTF